MRLFSFALLVLLLLMQACAPADIPTCENCAFNCLEEDDPDVISNDCMDDWECAFKVFQSSEVDISQNEGQAAGKMTVFQMLNSTQGSPMVTDDAAAQILVFELDESQNSFAVEDAQLEDMKVYFRRTCFCDEVEFKPVTIGCLQEKSRRMEAGLSRGN